MEASNNWETTMKAISSAAALLIFISGNAFAEVIPKGGDDYKCQTTGGFFDFSPANAIASCQQEIEDFCKTKNAPPKIKTINGEPSGPARYARAEISFQCVTAEDAVKKQQEIAEARARETRAELDVYKKMCAEDFGFALGTPGFSNCLLELQKQSFANKRTAQEIAAQNEIVEAQMAEKRRAEDSQNATQAIQQINDHVKNIKPYVFQPRPSTTVNCQTYGANTTCNSY